MKTQLIALMAFLLGIVQFPFAQSNTAATLTFEVNRVYPTVSLDKEKLAKAKTLLDLNERYPSSWVKTYLSVEVFTKQHGQTRKAGGKNESLNPEQKALMNMADTGTEISVVVRYIPENNLTHNDPKEMSFTVSVNPEQDATYAEGVQAMEKLLKENAINKIPEGTFEGYAMAAVKFTVDEAGRILEPHIFWPSDNEKVDQLLLDAICNMPNWTPASYADGTKVSQEFVLTVGNMESCVVPLLNIERE